MVADPFDQAARLDIREAAGGGGHLLHSVKEGFLLAPARLRLRVPGHFALGNGVEGGDLCGFLRFAVVIRVLGAFVVCVRGAGEQTGVRKHAPGAGRGRLAGHRLFPLLPHRHPMTCEGDGERLDGREQLLLQAHHEQAAGGPCPCRGVLQPLFPQSAVLVEKAREHKLRRVLRQILDGDAPHLPLGKAALNLPDVVLDAPNHHVFERVLAPDRHPAGETVWIEQLEQGGETVGMAVVRRGGQEQAVLETTSEIADRTGELRLYPVTPATRRRGVVGLVQDQQAARLHLAEPFAHGVRVSRIDEKVVGDEKSAVGTPRIDAEAPLLANPSEIRAVEDYEYEAEALLHLGLPLLQHGRGRGDHDRLDLLAKQQLTSDETGLDGLAQARVVGDEEIHARQAQRLAQRFHLVGVDLDAGSKRRLEKIRVGGGDAVPAQGVQEGAEVTGRVEAPGADGAPCFLLQDAAVDLEVPIDLQGLPLGVVVGAREADARGGGRGGVFHTLHQPASRAHLDELADARGTFRQMADGLAQCRSRYIAGLGISRRHLPMSCRMDVTLRAPPLVTLRTWIPCYAKTPSDHRGMGGVSSHVPWERRCPPCMDNGGPAAHLRAIDGLVVCRR